MIELSYNTKLLIILILIIVVVAIGFYIDCINKEKFTNKTKLIFPKHGICNQHYLLSNNDIKYYTVVNGKLTNACKFENDKMDKNNLFKLGYDDSGPYRCHLTTDENGNSCMEELTSENIKYPFYHFPEEGNCKQTCHIVCDIDNPPNCYTKCYTYVNDTISVGCNHLINTPGETNYYKCKLSKTPSGRKCMEKAF